MLDSSIVAKRNEYLLHIEISQRKISKVIVDQHYKKKHSDVTDEVILELVRSLDNEVFPVEAEEDGYEYFTAEPVFQNKKPYRLVMVLCIYEDYLGVINAFRVNRKKYE